MIKPGLALFASTLFLGCTAAAPTTDRATTEMQTAYAKLSELTASTSPVTVKTSVIATGSIADIAASRYFDLVTYYGGEQTRLETALHVVGDEPTDAYTIAWTESAPGGAAPAYTLRDVWEMAQGTPTASVADAVPLDDSGGYVRYHVDLTLAGQTRSYDALLIVEDGEPIVLDPVLWMMNQVLRDQNAATPAASPTASTTAHPDDMAQAPAPGTCAVTSWTNPTAQVDSHSGKDWHISGFHSAISSSNYQCTCDATCVSTCTPLGSSTATETGAFTPQPGLGWWHSANSQRADVPGTAQPGAGAQCDSAGGALVKNCLFGALCDVQIGFSYGGAGIAVTIPSGTYPSSVWVSAKSSLRGTCAPCVAAPAPAPAPAPNPNPVGGPVAGAGSGGGSDTGGPVATTN
jgi:hypothetical protein